MEMASIDKGRALLNGAYQKFAAVSVGEIQYEVLLAFNIRSEKG